MANRYWVGGSGTWSSSATANWSATSGGSGGASAPTSADTVIFDQAGTYTVTVNGSVAAAACLDFVVSAGTVTFEPGGAPTNNLNIFGSVTWTVPVTWSGNVGSTNIVVNFTATSAKNISTGGYNFTNSAIVFNGVGGSWTLQNNLTVDTLYSVTLTAGTLALGSYTLTAGNFSSNNSNTRSINFGTGKIVLTRNASNVVWDTGTVTGLTVSGTSLVEVPGNASNAVTKTITTGTLSEANSISFDLLTTGGCNFNLTGGVFKNLSITGNVTIANTALTIYGNYTRTAGTLGAGANTWTFAATSGTQTFNSGGVTHDFPITKTGAGTLQLIANNLSISTRLFTLTQGTLDLNNLQLTMSLFTGSNSNVRGINFGTSGKIVLSGSATNTIWNTATATNLTVSGTPLVECTGGGSAITKTISPGAATEANSISFSLLETTGTVTYTITSGTSNVRNLVINGTQTVSNSNIGIFGSFTHLTTNGTTTFTAGTNAWIFAATSGNYNINNIAGFTYDWPWTFGSAASTATWTVQNNLTLGATRALTLTNGTLDFNNKTLSGANGITVVTGSATLSNTGGSTFSTSLAITHTSGTLTLNTNLTTTNASGYTLTAGTLNLNDDILTAAIFSSNNANTRQIQFGTSGRIDVTGNSTTVLNFTTATGFTYTGTPRIYSTYSGGTGTRTFNFAGTAGAVAPNPSANPAVQGNVFDVSFGTSGTGIVITPGSDIKALTGAFNTVNLTNITGTNTLSNATRTIYGDLFVPSGTTALAAGTAVTTFAGLASQYITSNAVTLDFPITLNSTGGVNLNGALTLGSTRTLTLTGGGLNLADYTLTAQLLSSSGSTSRTIYFANTGQITLTGGGGNPTTVMDFSTATGFTYEGTPRIYSTYSSAAGIRTFLFGTTAGATSTNVLDVNFGSSGTGIVISTAADTKQLQGSYNNVNLTNFAGTISNNTRSIYGNFTVPATGGTLTSGASITSFVTTSTQTITTNGRVLNFPITIAGTGTTTLGDALDLGSTTSITLTTGTLALANFTLTTQTLVSNNANTRSIDFGSTGQINITGNNATILNFTTATGFTYTGTPRIYSTYTGATGTRTFNFGGTAGHTSTNVFDVSFGTSGTGLVINSTGADAKALQGGYGAFNLTGMTGTLALDARTVYGDFTVPAGATPTITAGSTATTFATAGVQTITTNGRNLDLAVTINNTGTTVLGDALNLGNRTFTLTSGTFDTNDFTVTAAALSSSNSNARTIAFDTTGQFTLTANAATIVDFAIMTDFSYTGTPRIYSTNTSGAAASTRTFNFGSTTGALPHNAFDLSIGTSGTGLVIAAAASDILSLNGGFNNFNLSGLTGTTQTIALTTRTVFGDFVVPATGGTINTGLTTTTISAPSTAPVANGYSTYFDGVNTSFLSVPGNTAFAFGTGAFTIECWVNVSTAQRVVTNRTAGASAAGTWSLTVGPTSVSFTEVVTGEPGVSGGVGTTSIANTWAHVAVCRDSGTTKIFVNGNQVASAVQTTNFTNTANIINIGRSPGDGSIVGCISNVRIVKGQAVYFSNFTPSTQPLTTSSQSCDPTKVSLLTCQTEDFIDASQNNFTVTRNGAAHAAYLSPFGAQTATTKNVTINGRALNFHVQFGTPISGSGINTLQDNFDVGSANTYAIRFGNGTLDVNNKTISGSSAGITVVNGCSFTLNNTGGSTVTTSMGITHTNGSLTLGTNLTTTNASGYTLTLGDLVLNAKTLTTPVFSSSNSNYRWIKTADGSGNYSGKIIVNSSSNGTVWNTSTTTNLINDFLDVESIGGGTNAITKTLNFGTGSYNEFINLSILDTTASGAPNYTVTTNQIRNLTINANVTSFTNSVINIRGNYAYSTTNGTTTFAAGTNAWTFDGYSGYNFTINPGSATYDFPWIIGSTGATAWDSTWTLQSNLTLGATRSLTLRRAEIDFNNYAISGGNGLTINPGSSGAVATTKVKSTGASTFTTSLPITHTTGYLDLAVNLTTSSTSGYTLTAGTVGLNTYTLTTPVFSSSNANTRSINFGTGKIVLNGAVTATIWTTATVTNLTVSGNPLVECIGGGTAVTKTINTGALSEANSISFSLLETTGTATYTFTASNVVRNLIINGTQTVSNVAILIYGDYTYNNTNGTTSFPGGTNAWTFAATSGSDTITGSPATTLTGSALLNGTTQYLSIGYNANQALTDQNFTIEAWVYPTATTALAVNVINTWYGVGGQYLLRFNVTTGRPSFTYTTTGDVQSSVTGTTTSVTRNAWNHIAVVRNSGTITLYVNGVADATTGSIGSDTIIYRGGTAKDIRIGADTAGSAYTAGYISNVRQVIGVAVYTGNFTPPNLANLATSGSASAAAYSSTTNVNTSFAASATKLLTCQSSTQFVDNSNNAFTVTGVADPVPSLFGINEPLYDFPWTFGSAASTATWTLARPLTIGVSRTTTLTHGTLALSSYTLSTGLFASTNSNTRTLNFGTGKISTTSTTTNTVWTTATVTNLSISGTPLVECIGGGTGVTKTINTGALSEANTLSFSLLETSGTVTYAFTAGNNIKNLLLNGNQTLSNIAINIYGNYTYDDTNGTTGITGGTNAWTFAATSGTKTITGSTSNGTSALGGAIAFDGSGDTITTPANAVLAPTGDFTIEAWVFASTLTQAGLVLIGNPAANAGRLQLALSGANINLYMQNNALAEPLGASGLSGAHNIKPGTWFHVAAVRSGNDYTIYINGTSVATTNSATAMTYATNVVNIGVFRASNVLYYWDGYVSNFRLVNGVAVYTGNFTPPSLAALATSGASSAAAYPSTTNVNVSFASTSTELLTGQSIYSVTDASDNAFTLTQNGNASSVPIYPFTNVYNFPWTFNGVGGTWELQQNTYIGTTRTATLTNGTLNLNGKVYSVGLFATGVGTKNLTFNGGELELNGSGTAFNNAQPTNFTTTAGSANGTIRTKSPGATTFAGNGSTYAATLAQDGGALTITGSNTFYDISTPCTARSSNSLTLTAGTTQTVTNFTATGQYTGQLENNLLSIWSSVAGTHATIYATSAENGLVTGIDYLSCTDISFTPFSTNGSDYVRWYIGDNSAHVNNCRGAIFKTYSANTSPRVYLMESGSSWTTPSDFNVNDNIIHLIGGGGGGASGFGGTGTDYAGGGGGGGGYTKVINYYSYSQLPVTFTVGGGGSGGVGEGGSATSGGTTTFSTYTAAGGTGPTGRIGGAGGVGSTYTGGNGGTGPATENGNSGGGGGGAAGPLGNGGNGGNGDNTGGLTRGGGGGGGNGGGTAGAASNSSSGATGGNNAAGQGGAGSNANGTAGGGGGGRPAGGGGGGLGSFGIDILNSFGSGGGSGGGGSSGGTGAAGLGYGSAGGGGGVNNSSAGWNGGNGYQGVIIIQYVPGTAPLPASAKMFMMFT